MISFEVRQDSTNSIGSGYIGTDELTPGGQVALTNFHEPGSSDGG